MCSDVSPTCSSLFDVPHCVHWIDSRDPFSLYILVIDCWNYSRGCFYRFFFYFYFFIFFETRFDCDGKIIGSQTHIVQRDGQTDGSGPSCHGGWGGGGALKPRMRQYKDAMTIYNSSGPFFDALAREHPDKIVAESLPLHALLDIPNLQSSFFLAPPTSPTSKIPGSLAFILRSIAPAQK